MAAEVPINQKRARNLTPEQFEWVKKLDPDKVSGLQRGQLKALLDSTSDRNEITAIKRARGDS
jgi:hypothetical protein